MANENISRIVSDFEGQLSGAIAVGATSFTIQSVLDLDGNTLSDGIYAFTIDRDSTGAKEYLIGQLTASTKTVSSISSVGRQGALTANAQRSHRIGANVIISDHSILAAISRIFTGVGTINPAAPLAYTSAPTLSSATQIATKGYVDSLQNGASINTDRIILGSQTAGETVAAGSIVYFKSSDSRWWLADADVTATFQNVQLGVALGSGTAGNAITGGVLIYGKCDSFTGLTATATYYLSNTAGAVATSAGTYSVILGQAFATTGIFFNPNATLSGAIATSAGVGDAGKLTLTNSGGLLSGTFMQGFGDGSDGDVTISSPTTLTKDMYYNNLVVTSTLNTNGWRVFVKGTVSGAGTLANNGNAASGQTGGTAHTGYFVNVAGVSGPNGGFSGDSVGGNAGTSPTNALHITAAGAGGKAGRGDSGAGAAPDGGAGGTGVITAYPIGKQKLNTIHLVTLGGGALTPYRVGGSGGSGGAGGDTGTAPYTGGAGGGGGASGGLVLLCAKTWSGTFTIEAKGGAGGNGVNATGDAAGGGGGGGGAGGYTLVVYQTKTWTGSYTITGGAGGTKGSPSGSGVNDGTDGAAGGSGASLEVEYSNLMS